MDIQPRAPRYSIEPTADGLRVVIPPRRNWWAIVFSSVWLTMWFLGERSALSQLAGGSISSNAPKHMEPGFLMLWLVMWTVGGLVVASTLVWQLGGREIIAANAMTLSQRLEAFGIGITRNYSLPEIRDLRAAAFVNNLSARRRALFPGNSGNGVGSIAFDYGAKTVRVGQGMDEAEAKMLVADLSKRLRLRAA